MWCCLEEGKNFLSASSFNLYYRYFDYFILTFFFLSPYFSFLLRFSPPLSSAFLKTHQHTEIGSFLKTHHHAKIGKPRPRLASPSPFPTTTPPSLFPTGKPKPVSKIN
jgi:hypothetical protein